MPKINRGYQSLYEYLAAKDFPFIRWIDKRWYPEEVARMQDESAWSNDPASYPYRRWNPEGDGSVQIVGSFQPLADMLKDAVDTFKPYKAGYQAKRDYFQPLRGLGNIARGMASLLCAPLVFLVNTVKSYSSPDRATFFQNMKLNFSRTTSWMLDGIASLIRGVTQIATTPLTWLIKMPLRGLITLFKGRPLFEERASVQRLVQEGNRAVNDTDNILAVRISNELARKFKKGVLQRKQKTNIPFHKGKCLVGQGQTLDAQTYLGLFKTNQTKMRKMPVDPDAIPLTEASQLDEDWDRGFHDFL